MEPQNKENYLIAVRAFLKELHEKRLPLKVGCIDALPIDSVDIVFHGLQGYNWAFVAEARERLETELQSARQTFARMQNNLSAFRNHNDLSSDDNQTRIAHAEERIETDFSDICLLEKALAGNDEYLFCVNGISSFESERDIVEAVRQYLITYFSEFYDISVIWDDSVIPPHLMDIDDSDDTVPFEDFEHIHHLPDIGFLYR